jgi:hypothetical protein
VERSTHVPKAVFTWPHLHLRPDVVGPLELGSAALGDGGRCVGGSLCCSYRSVLLAVAGYTAASGDWFRTAVPAAGIHACLALANVRKGLNGGVSITYFVPEVVEHKLVAHTACLGSFRMPVALVESHLASSWAQSDRG